MGDLWDILQHEEIIIWSASIGGLFGIGIGIWVGGWLQSQ